MQISELPRDSLLAPLRAVSKIISAKHTLPILSQVLLKTGGGKLRVTGSDLDIQITAESVIEGLDQDQAITLPAKKLLDIVQTLPADSVLSLKGSPKVMLKSGRGRYNLQSLPAADFPSLAITEKEATLVIDKARFKELLSLVSFAMAVQDIRYYLNGVLLHLDGTKLTVVASDGHRMTSATHELENAHDSRRIIIPRNAVLELLRLIDDDGPLTIDVLQNQASFRFDSIELITRLVDGHYPDFTRVIPADPPQHRVLIGRETFLATLKRAAILTRSKFRSVRVTLADGAMKIACDNEYQEESEEEIPVTYDGPPVDTGFNVDYLVGALSTLTTPDIEISFETDKGLVMMPERSDFKYVVMAMRL